MVRNKISNTNVIMNPKLGYSRKLADGQKWGIRVIEKVYQLN